MHGVKGVFPHTTTHMPKLSKLTTGSPIMSYLIYQYNHMPMPYMLCNMHNLHTVIVSVETSE